MRYRKKVFDNLKKQSVLFERFNIDITSAMLQHDLERMAKNTKDAQGLKQLFALFNNNPETIANCISLPNLVEKKLQNSYNWNTEIHAETQKLAENELAIYQQTGHSDDLSIQPINLTYTEKSDELDQEQDEKTEPQKSIIKLEPEAFEQQRHKLQNQNLQTTEYGYLYQEVLSNEPQEIQIESFVWHKQALADWLSQQIANHTALRVNTAALQLPSITGSQQDFAQKSVTSDQWLPSSYWPSKRTGHTAIWTGSEMIVWGGDDGSLVDTGGRYNPLTDSWVATSTSSAPSGRHLHTAIWTGSEMIVWGGYVNTGGRYNPVTDSWVATSTSSAPSARRYHTAIWTGSEMIVWGGNDGSLVDTGGRYNPSTDSWVATSTSSVPSGRRWHTAIWTGSEMIVWGGNLYDANVGVYQLMTQYEVSGNLLGLTAGQVTLQNNAGDDLVLSTDGSFNFSTPLNDGTDYEVTVLAQPATSPNQTCEVSGGHDGDGTGTISSADVNNIVVTCATTQYDVNVIVNGLATGNTVEVSNGGSDVTLSDVSNTASFTLNDGTAYAVTTTNATTPNQTCTVTGGTNNDGSGTLNGGDVAITINCVTNAYDVNVTVNGLATGNTVEVSNGGVTNLVSDMASTTSFTLNDGTAYAVTTTDATTPNQSCTVSGGTNGDGSGTLNGGDVAITINCVTNQYSVGGNVSGLSNGNEVILQNNAGDDLTVLANGSFTFATKLDDESDYAVTVLTEPSAPNQTCAVTGGTDNDGTGTLAGNDDTSVVVTCTTIQYSVGGMVSGLATDNEVILQNNAGDDLTVSANGSFTFATKLDDESDYAVTVLTNPTAPNQVCNITQGTGQLSGENVTSVVVDCVTDVHMISGQISGLRQGNHVTLSMNAGDEYLTIDANGGFEFINAIEDGSDYEVTVLTQPTTPNQTCEVSGGHDGDGSGTVSGNDISDLDILCDVNQYFIGGTTIGLIPDNSLVLQNNGSDDLMLTSEGTFVFATALDDESAYEVSIDDPANDPIQPCEVVNADGDLAGDDIDNVLIVCEFGDDLIYRHGFDTLDAISREYWEPED